ncbi:hypothetical protein [Photobacterium damselae]|uniref:hypothetical protein n=1 Tax=Photobacterium damselae TaxID=38293 RepID=UPI002543B134
MKIILVLLLFFILFAFKIPILIHSAVIGGLLSLFFIFYNGYTYKLKRLLSLFNIRIMINLNFGFFLVLFFPTIYGTYDYSMMKSLFSQFVTLNLCSFYCVLIYGYCESRNKNLFMEINKYIFHVFIIQAVIIFVALIFPSIKNIIIYFHRGDINVLDALNIGYSGLRNNALSGTLYFGLAIVYALANLIILFHINNNGFSYKKLILFIIINISGLTVGRFSLVYLLVIPVFLMGNKNLANKTAFIFRRAIMSLGVIVALFTIAISTIDKVNIVYNKTFYPYVFEMYDNYINTGTASTASTDRLETMFPDLSIETILEGDGKYTSNGSYYGNSDVGYVRNIYFGGILFMMYFLLSPLLILWPMFKYKRIINNYNVRYLGLAILMMTYISHFKGEVSGFAIGYQSLLYIYCFSYYLYCESNK